MTEDKLTQAAQAHAEAIKQAEQLRHQRDTLIRQALKDGWTHARIARATGLTRGRIGQFPPATPAK